jgi:hypothetical protein
MDIGFVSSLLEHRRALLVGIGLSVSHGNGEVSMDTSSSLDVAAALRGRFRRFQDSPPTQCFRLKAKGALSFLVILAQSLSRQFV